MFERFPRQSPEIKKPAPETAPEVYPGEREDKEVIEMSEKLRALEEEQLKARIKYEEAHSEYKKAPENGMAMAKDQVAGNEYKKALRDVIAAKDEWRNAHGGKHSGLQGLFTDQERAILEELEK